MNVILIDYNRDHHEAFITEEDKLTKELAYIALEFAGLSPKLSEIHFSGEDYAVFDNYGVAIREASVLPKPIIYRD